MVENELQSVAFPKLSSDQIASLGRCPAAARRRLEAGEPLFQVGDRDFKFFVIISGEVEVLDPSGDTPKPVVVHRPGEFTGDVSHLTGNPSILTAVARTECEVYEVSTEALRELLNRRPDLSDLILQAFIARRQL